LFYLIRGFLNFCFFRYEDTSGEVGSSGGRI